MKVKNLSYEKGKILNGPLLLDFEPITDNRGYFYEKWNKKKFLEFAPLEFNLVQENISKSYKGVLRGLHYQINPNAQCKIVSCLKGEIFDVAVDIRKNSSTFGKWISAFLNEKNKSQLLIPEGFAHGFISLSDEVIVNYKTNNYWSQTHERSILWNDKIININWPLHLLGKKNLIISEKDKNAKSLDQLLTNELL